MENKDQVRTLTRLGLTSCEARVYLALARSGLATVKAISKVSNIAREEIYRIMPKLQKLGLVEKTISHPTMFKPIQIKDAVYTLMNHKLEEIRELRQETKELIQDFRENNVVKKLDFEEPQFILIPEKEALVSRVKKTIETTQTSIVIVCPRQAFPRGLLILAEKLEKAMNRGVKIRLIFAKPEGLPSWPEIVQELMKNPCFKFKTVPSPLKTRLGMYDKKEVFIASKPTSYAMMSPCLWSNNPSILAIIQDYIEILWLTAKEEIPEEQ